jgi:hypothetical protein
MPSNLFELDSEEAAQNAVRSIRRGSDGWRNVVKPFVSNLVFRSLFQARSQAEIVFRPYRSHAAVVGLMV